MLTNEARRELKQRIDIAKRRKMRHQAYVHGTCTGCGVEWDWWTLGCRQCKNRHYNLHKKGKHPNPHWYAKRCEEHMLYVHYSARVRRGYER